VFRERSIIHFNVADFAVAVERMCDNSLRRRPLIIAPLQAARAVVYDMSEEAYQDGVRKKMALAQAKKRCPEAVVVSPRIELYRRAMQQCIKRVKRFSPCFEHGWADGHLFVDMTGTHRLFGPAPDVAWKVRKEVRNDLGIAPIWSVSPSKLVAKVASRVVKPSGEYIVGAGEEEAFLAPLPVSLLPGLHWWERRMLDELNIARIGEIARLSRQELVIPFGGRGDFFHDTSRGIDHQAVGGGARQDSTFCYDHHFADDTNDQSSVRRAVAAMAAQAGAELRDGGRAVRRIGLRLIYSDGLSAIRQASRRVGSCDDTVLRDMALLALERAWRRRTRLRSCHLVCDRLHRRSPQLSLLSMLPEQQPVEENLLGALDTIRHRFGKCGVQRGCRLRAAPYASPGLAPMTSRNMTSL